MPSLIQTCVSIGDDSEKCSSYVNGSCEIDMDCNAHHMYVHKRCVNGSCVQIFDADKMCTTSDECGKSQVRKGLTYCAEGHIYGLEPIRTCNIGINAHTNNVN